MYNIHLDQDSKRLEYLKMKWQRDEPHNTIIAVDGSVQHNYHYKDRKYLNRDWHELNIRKQDNLK